MNPTSKTQAPCDCGWLSSAINDPGSGVLLGSAASQVFMGSGNTKYCIYHCPFCGGKLANPAKPVGTPAVPPSEWARVAKLAEGLTSVHNVLAALGNPDYDAWTHPEKDFRALEYHGLSKVLILEFSVNRTGKVKPTVRAKNIFSAPGLAKVDYAI